MRLLYRRMNKIGIKIGKASFERRRERPTSAESGTEHKAMSQCHSSMTQVYSVAALHPAAAATNHHYSYIHVPKRSKAIELTATVTQPSEDKIHRTQQPSTHKQDFTGRRVSSTQTNWGVRIVSRKFSKAGNICITYSEARSCSHCLVCVCVCIQHAVHTRHIILSSVARPAL